MTCTKAKVGFRHYGCRLNSPSVWKAAGFLGMSPKGRVVSVAETAADLTGGLNQKKNPNDFWSEWQDLNLRPLRPERLVSLCTS